MQNKKKIKKMQLELVPYGRRYEELIKSKFNYQKTEAITHTNRNFPKVEKDFIQPYDGSDSKPEKIKPKKKFKDNIE